MIELSDEISEQRKIQYRNLLDEIEAIHDNENDGVENPDRIDRILNRVDSMLLNDEKLEEKLTYTDEFVLDATLIAKANSFLNKYTNTIVPVLDTYNSSDFGTKIRLKYLKQENSDEQENMLDFSNLYEVSRKILKGPPDFCYMCGFDVTVFEKSQKLRKVREKLEKAKDIEKKIVEKLSSTQKEEDSVDNTVKFLFWALNKEYRKRHEPVNYFKFAFDPECFGQTVENCFHLSFLVRDARVSIGTDENGVYVLTPISSKEQRKSESDEHFLQHILSLDTQVWKLAIKSFGLKECLLKKWKVEWEQKNS